MIVERSANRGVAGEHAGMRTTAPGDQLLTGACLVVSSWPLPCPVPSRRSVGLGPGVGLHHDSEAVETMHAHMLGHERPARTAEARRAKRWPQGARKRSGGSASRRSGARIAATSAGSSTTRNRRATASLGEKRRSRRRADLSLRPVVQPRCARVHQRREPGPRCRLGERDRHGSSVLAGDGDSQINVASPRRWQLVAGSPAPPVRRPRRHLFQPHQPVGRALEIDFVTPCQTFTYQVTGHQVVQKGSPVYSPSTESSWCSRPATRPNALFLRTSAISSRPSSSRCASTTGAAAVASPPEPNLPIPAR